MRRRYIQVNGELKEVGLDYVPEPRTPFVMPDIKPYQSQIDGTIIKSRSHHREHLRDHRCVEVGNDSSLQRTERPALQPPPGLKEQIARNVYQKLKY